MNKITAWSTEVNPLPPAIRIKTISKSKSKMRSEDYKQHVTKDG
jgi:hypothetical protein